MAGECDPERQRPRRQGTSPPDRLGWKAFVERVMGIEPTLSAWEAEVLPLNYTRREPRILRGVSPVRQLSEAVWKFQPHWLGVKTRMMPERLA